MIALVENKTAPKRMLTPPIKRSVAEIDEVFGVLEETSWFTERAFLEEKKIGTFCSDNQTLTLFAGSAK
jgi:hypothetical protein